MQDFWKTALTFWLPWEPDGIHHDPDSKQRVDITDVDQEDPAIREEDLNSDAIEDRDNWWLDI